MSNYTATIVEITNIRKHENADRLQITNIFGNNVIVGLDTKIGDIGVFFVLESQIGQDFAKANDLIRRKDESGKSVGGMLENNRRVRCLKLRGEKSMGLFCPISALNKTFEYLNKKVPVVKVGDEFEELDGVIISQKYISPKNLQSLSKNKAKNGKKALESRLVDKQLSFHFDTSQLGKNIHKINPDSLISITFKMHGTSGVASRILVKRKLNVFEKLLKFFKIKIEDKEYDYIYSSRRVIKNGVVKEHNHYYGTDIWSHAGEQFKNKLHKGETCYYEIVGFTPEGREIQKGFDYGCKPGEYKIYVYRITQTNVDGVVTELPWHQVKERCWNIGIDHVPEIYYGKACGFQQVLMPWDEDPDIAWRKLFLKKLQDKYVYDQDSQFCKNKVPEEGVVVRTELGDGIENFKLKSFKFLQWETKQLDSDAEDIESEN